MSKRPASDISTDSNKKTRTDETSTGPFDKESAMLESLKKEMDSLLDQANEHHEEVRIAAVDTAFDLEEKLKESEEAKEKALCTLRHVTINLENAEKYLQEFSENNAMQMLTKVSSSSIQNINTLKEDSKKAETALNKLKSLKQTYKEKQAQCKDKFEQIEMECAKLKDKYNAAEHYVESVTNLNQ